jgi:hypothetical protein
MVRHALISLLLVCALTAPAGADTLSELLDRADMAFRSDTSAAVLEMHIKTDAFERSYKIVSWDDRRGGKERALIKILGPALWRGHGTLKLGSQLKLYNPKTNHISVVSSSMLGDSWMGSHFTNDDLVKETRLAEDFELALDKKWRGRYDELGKEVTFYRIRLTPKPTAPVAWGRILYQLAVDGDRVYPVEVDYYRKKTDRVAERTMTFSGLKELGGRVLPSQMKVTVADEPGEFTRMTYVKLELDRDIPSSKFTEQALRK